MGNNNVTNNPGDLAIKTEGKMKRSLGFWPLVLFGVISMSPTVGLVYFPSMSPETGGYTHIAFLVATILIIFTVFSYQSMVKEYPQTGSAYTYASKGINGHVGFMVGWIFLLDYALTPMFALSLCGMYLNSVLPGIPVQAIVIVFAVIVVMTSILGVKISVAIEIIIGLYLILLVFFFDGNAINQVVSSGESVFNAGVFLDTSKIKWDGVMQAAGLGLLSFCGFDAITTLVEESTITVKKLSHTLLWAVILSSIFFISSTYFAQLAMGWQNIPEADLPTAYRYMLSVWTSPQLAMALVLIQKVGSLALCIAFSTATSRILFGMGRDNVLPKKFFGHLHPKFGTPIYSILLTGVLMLLGALLIPWDIIAEIVSFGACLGFISVNISTINHFWVRKKERKIFRYMIFPCFATTGIFWVLISLSPLCLITGVIWTVIGLLYMLFKNKTSEEFRKATRHGIDGM